MIGFGSVGRERAATAGELIGPQEVPKLEVVARMLCVAIDRRDLAAI
jgi:hypothetical protein